MKDTLLSLTLPGDYVITPPPNFVTPPEDGLSGIIRWIIILLVASGIIAALVFLIWGAIKWIASGGDKEKLESARRTIIYAIIGLIVVLFSVIIVQFIGSVLGVKIFNIPQRASGNIEGVFNCPDGTDNYACGKTSDTQCPLCSPTANCSIAIYSIAQCSGDSSGCKVSSDCPSITCPRGMVAMSYCSKASSQEIGICKSHCVNPSEVEL